MGMAYGGCCCRWYWAESKSISLCCSSSSVSVSVADATKKRLLRTCGRPMVVSLSKSKSNDDDIIISDDDKEDNSNSGGGSIKVKVKGSGTTARGRRLLRIREEKQQREYDRLHNYPAWAKVLEDACKHDTELRTVLGDSIGNPELMKKRVEDRIRKKGRDFRKSKTGSVVAFKVTFRE